MRRLTLDSARCCCYETIRTRGQQLHHGLGALFVRTLEESNSSSVRSRRSPLSRLLLPFEERLLPLLFPEHLLPLISHHRPQAHALPP